MKEFLWCDPSNLKMKYNTTTTIIIKRLIPNRLGQTRNETQFEIIIYLKCKKKINDSNEDENNENKIY
jgi:hypothetical protein